MSPIGTINLPLMRTSHDKQRRKMTLIDFVVIQHPTEHNITMGRTNLLKLGVILSTTHGIVKFNTTEGPGTVLVTQLKQLQCFKVMWLVEIALESKKVCVKLTKGKRNHPR